MARPAVSRDNRVVTPLLSEIAVSVRVAAPQTAVAMSATSVPKLVTLAATTLPPPRL